MVHFVGAGSGAADLITVRGAKLLGVADVVVYAGSLVNPAVLDYTNAGCRSVREQQDPDVRPAISGSVENMEQYDIVLM